MTILSAQSIERRLVNQYPPGSPEFKRWERLGVLKIEPFEPVAKQALGLSYGLTAAGYDIRLGQFPREQYQEHPLLGRVMVNTPEGGYQSWILEPGGFLLVSSLERVSIPKDLQVIVHDKSSLARQGLALQNTVLEPGWNGYITLELSNHGGKTLFLKRGQPIAQLVFHQLDQMTNRPYTGKYQDQGPEPTEAIHTDEVPNE